MRYAWKIKGMPTHCAYGTKNSVDPSFICKLGIAHQGGTIQWEVLRKVCWDIQILVPILQVSVNNFIRKVNTADNARLDIFATGL